MLPPKEMSTSTRPWWASSRRLTTAVGLCAVLVLAWWVPPKSVNLPSIAVVDHASCVMNGHLQPLLSRFGQQFENQAPSNMCCVGSETSGSCWPRPSQPRRPLRMLFYSNQLGLRGTEIALFDYAHYFEALTCGEAHIGSRVGAPEMEGKPKFDSRFGYERVHLIGSKDFASIDDIVDKHSIDVVYTLQAGNDPPWRPPRNASLLMHGVFWEHDMLGNRGQQPGRRLAVISESVEHSPDVPVVPHMVNMDPCDDDVPGMRPTFQIAQDARVFCRHGGFETFSDLELSWVWPEVCSHARAYPEDYFLLMNTNPGECSGKLSNVIHLPGSPNMTRKRSFLNTCNACLHARRHGESFGLAVAECSMSGLPVITHAHPSPGGDNHLRILGPHALPYHDADSLASLLRTFDVAFHGSTAQKFLYQHLYDAYSPGKVMQIFLQEFAVLHAVMAGVPT